VKRGGMEGSSLLVDSDESIAAIGLRYSSNGIFDDFM